MRNELVRAVGAGHLQQWLAGFDEHFSTQNDVCLLWRIAVLSYNLPELFRGYRIARFQLHGGESLVQAHVHRFHALKFLESSAHGEGAGHSIHAEDGKIHLQELSSKRSKAHEQSDKQK